MSKLTLDAECTIYQAAVLHQRCLELLQSTDVMVLDCGQVIEMDSSALQIMLWLQAEARQAGKSMKLSNVSPAVREMLDLTGASLLLQTAMAGGADES